jgi:hypothetical protein
VFFKIFCRVILIIQCLNRNHISLFKLLLNADYFGLNKRLLHSSSDYCILAFLSKFCSNNAAGNKLFVKLDVVIQIIVVCFINYKGTLLQSPLILVFIYKKLICCVTDPSVLVFFFCTLKGLNFFSILYSYV